MVTFLLDKIPLCISNRRLHGSQDRLWRGRENKILPLPRIDPWFYYPLVSHSSDQGISGLHSYILAICVPDVHLPGPVSWFFSKSRTTKLFYEYCVQLIILGSLSYHKIFLDCTENKWHTWGIRTYNDFQSSPLSFSISIRHLTRVSAMWSSSSPTRHHFSPKDEGVGLGSTGIRICHSSLISVVVKKAQELNLHNLHASSAWFFESETNLCLRLS
jgi:hypothetical protein